MAPQAVRGRHRLRVSSEFRNPSAGDTGGIHAADFSEYAALYEQAWITPNTRRVLAHLPRS